MCGRYTLHTPASQIARQFALFDLRPIAYRYNIAPMQAAPVVRLMPGAAARQCDPLRWGLVPSWADDPAIGNRMINARAETAAEKPAFRAAFRRRRCLVPADGFYEWLKIEGRKQPYYFQLRGGAPFAFAGLWESWEGAGHSALETFTLLTTDANALMRPIHDRMPVILPETAYQAWLDPSLDKPETLLPLLKPWPVDSMTCTAVSPRVNSPAFDAPECIEPVETQGELPFGQD